MVADPPFFAFGIVDLVSFPTFFNAVAAASGTVECLNLIVHDHRPTARVPSADSIGFLSPRALCGRSLSQCAKYFVSPFCTPPAFALNFAWYIFRFFISLIMLTFFLRSVSHLNISFQFSMRLMRSHNHANQTCPLKERIALCGF